MCSNAISNDAKISPRPSIFAFIFTGIMKNSKARSGTSGYEVVNANNAPQTAPDAPINSAPGAENAVCSYPPAMPDKI